MAHVFEGLGCSYCFVEIFQSGLAAVAFIIDYNGIFFFCGAVFAIFILVGIRNHDQPSHGVEIFDCGGAFINQL